MENDDSYVEPFAATHMSNQWVPETIQDVYNVIADKLTDKQREIIEAHLMGYTYRDLQVTEKYWRYHWGKAVQKIKKELGV